MVALELGIGYSDEAVARKVMCQPESDDLSSELRGSKLLFSFS